MRLTDFKLNKRDSIILIIIAITAAWRVLLSGHAFFPELANLSPLGAIALFGGAYLKNAKAYIFPIAAILISDLLLNLFVLNGEFGAMYEGFLWVYAAFALIVLTGRYLKANQNVGRFIASGALAVFIHWIVTDLGVWLGSGMYPLTAEGFLAALVAAIPFEMNFLYGTFIYSGVLFGAVELLKLRESKSEAAKVVAK